MTAYPGDNVAVHVNPEMLRPFGRQRRRSHGNPTPFNRILVGCGGASVRFKFVFSAFHRLLLASAFAFNHARVDNVGVPAPVIVALRMSV